MICVHNSILCYQLSPVIGALRPSVVFGYKYILLIFGIFLTYETRSVRLKVKQVNDSKFVGMSIYNVAVLCVNTTPFSNQENTTFDFVSLAIALCSFMSMGLIIVLELLWKKFRRAYSAVTMTQKGWLDGKESDCFPGQPGGRGETPENKQLEKQIAEGTVSGEYYPPQLIEATYQTFRDESSKQVDNFCGAPQSNKLRGISGTARSWSAYPTEKAYSCCY
ncbi:hypothetical protein RRG08_051567 [Elysia crispata]|uniref:G-protein coupled receptors family 3 profile domain-containing protein n=1 Tax=Elysia crispata TaxID=231223 RepID=A0AAE0ZIP7_9GAST|nr:hypothetical protein RRG08_051567 [Elysia crispata]